jgi:hypothetical protein
MKAAPDKKSAVFYVRCRKETKAWYYLQRKTLGYKSMSDFFEAFTLDQKEKQNARKKK